MRSASAAPGVAAGDGLARAAAGVGVGVAGADALGAGELGGGAPSAQAAMASETPPRMPARRSWRRVTESVALTMVAKIPRGLQRAPAAAILGKVVAAATTMWYRRADGATVGASSDVVRANRSGVDTPCNSGSSPSVT